MTTEELFLKEGATYFGNRLIWKHKDVGVKVPGGSLVLTPEGEDVHKMLADITDVEVKPVRTKRFTKSEPSAIDDLLSE